MLFLARLLPGIFAPRNDSSRELPLTFVLLNICTHNVHLTVY